MTQVNAKREGFRSKSRLNWMGGPSYDLSNPLVQLQMVASSSFFGEPQYYHESGTKGKASRKSEFSHACSLSARDLDHLRATLNGFQPAEWRTLSPAVLMEKAIDKALDEDVEATLRLAADLRSRWLIRTTPQVILVRAANHKKAKGTGLVRKFAKKIVTRLDEPATGLAYQLATYGKPVPNALKKAWRDVLQTADEYTLAKYRMVNRVVKTVDVVNLVHAKGPAIDKLMQGKAKTTGKTWEAVVSKEGSNQKSWETSIPKMGHMALLRNIRNFLEHDVDPKLFLGRLVETAPDGKQLPFRYVSALRALKYPPPQVVDALEECLEGTLVNLPEFEGRVMSLCDNSGSAWGTTTSELGTMEVAAIGNLTGVITGKRSEEGYVGLFGDRFEVRPVTKRDSVLAQASKLNRLGKGVGQATENGAWLFWDEAIREKHHWDHVFMYSDMQAGHGGLYGLRGTAYKDFIWPGSSRSERYIDIPKLISEYRAKVNPGVFVYLVQIAGYGDVIVPEFYDRTFILGGWSAQLLRFAAEMTDMYTPEECRSPVPHQ